MVSQTKIKTEQNKQFKKYHKYAFRKSHSLYIENIKTGHPLSNHVLWRRLCPQARYLLFLSHMCAIRELLQETFSPPQGIPVFVGDRNSQSPPGEVPMQKNDLDN